MLAEGAHCEAGRVDAAPLEMIDHRLGAALAEQLVVLLAAALVGVAADLDGEIGAGVEDGGDPVEGARGPAAELVGVEVEMDDDGSGEGVRVVGGGSGILNAIGIGSGIGIGNGIGNGIGIGIGIGNGNAIGIAGGSRDRFGSGLANRFGGGREGPRGREVGLGALDPHGGGRGDGDPLDRRCASVPVTPRPLGPRNFVFGQGGRSDDGIDGHQVGDAEHEQKGGQRSHRGHRWRESSPMARLSSRKMRPSLASRVTRRTSADSGVIALMMMYPLGERT